MSIFTKTDIAHIVEKLLFIFYLSTFNCFLLSSVFLMGFPPYGIPHVISNSQGCLTCRFFCRLSYIPNI